MLLILIETAKQTALKNAVTAIKDDINRGFSLTEAISNSKAFPWVVPCVIQAGEKGGRLDEVFLALGKYYERKDQIRSHIIRASGYPIFAFVIILALTLFVSLKVVPQLEALLPINQTSNFATGLILSGSHFLQAYWWIFILTIFVLITYARFIRTKHSELFARTLFNAPVVGDVAKNSSLSLYFLNLSLLVKSGVPLLESFSLLERVSPNLYVTGQFLTVRDYIVGGSSFSQALSYVPFFPSITQYSVRRGEESGNLDKALFGLANFFENDVIRKTDFALGLIQPTLIITCGGMLLLLAAAFLVPIYGNLTNIAGGGVL